MDLGQRSTFGAKSTEVVQPNNERQESGAVWKRQAKSGTMNFLSIKIKLTKEKLKSLLEKGTEFVDIGFVAFPNDFKKEDDKRPDFRVFEDKE